MPTMPVPFRGPGRLYLTFPSGTETEYICELMGVVMAPEADILSVTTGCGQVATVGPARWAFNMSWVQDVSAATTLTRLAKTHHGKIVPFVFVPNGLTKTQITATAPGYTGTTTVVAGPIGAQATEIAQAAPVWPITGEPAEVVTPPVLLMADEEEEEEAVA